jgi:COP9 signalosome complex subunit 1
VDRLNYIIGTCPSIATQALHLAVQHIHQLCDPSLYSIVQSSYEVLPGVSDGTLPHASQIAPLDKKWAEEMNAKNQAERIKLDVELKTYSNNMIKESIRVCPSDIFWFLQPRS